MQRGEGGDLRSVPRTTPATVYTLFPQEPGIPFSLSALSLKQLGEDVEILDVLALTSPNVEFLGTFAVWPSDLLEYGAVAYTGSGFPHKNQRVNHPAIGTVVPAAEFDFVPRFLGTAAPLTITAGFRIREGSVGAVNGLVVVYRRGDDIVREHVRSAVIACVKPMRDCGSQGGADETEILRELGLVDG
ncbi:MAG: hypothetical protein ACT4PP_09050 [Sporichthyaceae bacterium]